MMYKISAAEGSIIGDLIVDTSTAAAGKAIKGTARLANWLTKPVSGRINPLRLLMIGAVPMTLAYAVTRGGQKAKAESRKDFTSGKYIPGYAMYEPGNNVYGGNI